MKGTPRLCNTVRMAKFPRNAKLDYKSWEADQGFDPRSLASCSPLGRAVFLSPAAAIARLRSRSFSRIFSFSENGSDASRLRLSLSSTSTFPDNYIFGQQIGAQSPHWSVWGAMILAPSRRSYIV